LEPVGEREREGEGGNSETLNFRRRVVRKFPCVEISEAVSTRPSAERVKLGEVKGPKLRRNMNFDVTIGRAACEEAKRCNVGFGYKLSISFRTEENHGIR
jgi:hypothetical protein